MLWIMRKIIVNYLHETWGLAKGERRRSFLNQLERNSQASVLDCGCDDGSFSVKIAQKIGTEKIYGIEINEVRAIKAPQKGIIVSESDLNQKFPFQNPFFDVVTAEQVIEHMVDLDNFISELYRVLKPGGYGVICTENLASVHNIFALLCGNQPYSGPTLSHKYVIGHHPVHPTYDVKKTPYEAIIPQHTRVLAYKSLKKIFEIYKFKIESLFCIGYFPFPNMFSRLLCKINKWHAGFIGIKVRKI